MQLVGSFLKGLTEDSSLSQTFGQGKQGSNALPAIELSRFWSCFSGRGENESIMAIDRAAEAAAGVVM